MHIRQRAEMRVGELGETLRHGWGSSSPHCIIGRRASGSDELLHALDNRAQFRQLGVDIGVAAIEVIHAIDHRFTISRQGGDDQ